MFSEMHFRTQKKFKIRAYCRKCISENIAAYTNFPPSLFHHFSPKLLKPLSKTQSISIHETPKSKCSGNKGARISKPPRTPPIKKSPIVYIDEMPLFMPKYID